MGVYITIINSKNTSTSLEVFFTLPFSAEKIFDFVILPKNMPLYTGAFLIPGIVSVQSSETPRKIGTRDFILNNDGSSHSSVTIDLLRPTVYKLHIDQINSKGAKKILSSIVLGFKEEWILHPEGESTKIHRKLEILHAGNFFSKFFAEFILKPQLMASFKRHHKQIIKALS